MSEFKVELNEKTSVIFLPARLSEKEAVDFKSQINGCLLAPVDAFVMDFRNTAVIERQFYQVFLHFRSILKNSKKTVYSINLSRSLLTQIKTDRADREDQKILFRF